MPFSLLGASLACWWLVPYLDEVFMTGNDFLWFTGVLMIVAGVLVGVVGSLVFGPSSKK
jgi:hypothetical protein